MGNSSPLLFFFLKQKLFYINNSKFTQYIYTI